MNNETQTTLLIRPKDHITDFLIADYTRWHFNHLTRIEIFYGNCYGNGCQQLGQSIGAKQLLFFSSIDVIIIKSLTDNL